MKLDVIQLNKDQFFNDSKLREKSLEVVSFDQSFQNEVDNLIDTLDSWNIAIGLSAPQVGIKKRLAVVRLNKDDDPLVLVNPVILNLSGKKDTKKESCLSLPKVRGEIVRRYKLSLEYQDRYGAIKNLDVEGFFARVILHEIDHLDGILFVDRMVDSALLEDFDIPWE